MKKIFAIVSLVVLSACGGNGASTEVTTTDSSTVVVDSTKVDSTAVPVEPTKVDEAPKVEEVK
jgi:hypothetical protein